MATSRFHCHRSNDVGFDVPPPTLSQLGAHRLDGPVIVKLSRDVLLHVREYSGNHEQPTPKAEAQSPRKGRGDRGVVQFEALGALVHNEEHFGVIGELRLCRARGGCCACRE